MKQDIDVICKHYDESQETLRDHRDQLEVVQGQVDMLLVSPRQILVDIIYNPY